jgi:hypothetical protein
MGSELDINLEGSKAGPRPRFDSYPRVTESGTTRDAPVQGQGLSHALEAPPDVFEVKREVDGGIPSEGGIEPLDPIARNQDPHDYSLAFLRAPSWPLVDSYRMEHGLPLEFPVSSSPETVGTRLTRVVRRSPPLLLFLKKEREGRTIKDGRDPDRPRTHEAQGLDYRRPNLERKRTKRATIQKAFLDKTPKKPRRSLNTPPRPRGLHQAGALARTHRKKLRHQFMTR